MSDRLPIPARRALAPAALSLALASAFAAALTGCAATDVVAKYAAISFKAVAGASEGRVAYSAAEGSWRLGSPAGDAMALSPGTPSIALEFDLAPLEAAGLDPSRLPATGYAVAYAAGGGRLAVRAELGGEPFPAEASTSIEAAFAALLASHRSAIGYHEEFDHYGIKLGGGNMFEWAKDLLKNDKDIVFVLDPAPLLAAGLDPARLPAGWAFATVESKDASGKAVFEDKLLRPFDLK